MAVAMALGILGYHTMHKAGNKPFMFKKMIWNMRDKIHSKMQVIPSGKIVHHPQRHYSNWQHEHGAHRHSQ